MKFFDIQRNEHLRRLNAEWRGEKYASNCGETTDRNVSKMAEMHDLRTDDREATAYDAVHY